MIVGPDLEAIVQRLAEATAAVDHALAQVAARPARRGLVVSPV